jgi:mono/diheme cytochrome c family protein
MSMLLGCLTFTAATLFSNHASTADEDAELLFVRRIQPLFSEKCLACHGNDESDIQGGFDMRSLATMLQGGDHETPVVVAGKPNESPIYLAILRTHDDWQPMPPKEADKLHGEQVQWVKRWIEGGSPWPDSARVKEIELAYVEKWSAEDGSSVATSGGQSPEWTNRRYKPESLWGYQPVKKVEVASLNHEGKTAIDWFIDERMPSGLEPAPTADRRSLIRRVTFDLIGLPPNPAEIESFLQDQSPVSEALAKVVDRLLESPHYGERMAQHWLDVVRYADSSGFANDFARGNAWRYRDYVIRAFNADKPYDQFIREQIAGDEIATDDPEKIVATGFLRMGPWELTAMEVAKIARQRFLDDVTNSVGETFLAHSLQCARCHDHKFDPVPTQDYYSIQAVFATTQLTERPTDFLPTENTKGFEEKKYLEQQQVEHLATLRMLDEKSLQAVDAWYAEKQLDPGKWRSALQEVNPKKESKRGGIFGAVRGVLLKQAVPENQFPPRMLGLTPEEIGLERIASKGLQRIPWELDRYQPFALAVYNGRTPQMTSVAAPVRMPEDRMTHGELEDTCILAGGDPFGSGPKVKPGVLSVLASSQRGSIPEGIEGRRLAFADWVASADNPLTTRTIVNRMWMWHFGDPIAGNPNNFGSTGKRPTHPELLDWLAATFVEKGWSFKELHRVIMTSEAYRRSTVHPDREILVEKDPLGTSYAVFKPRRLTAEELRDSILVATGELNREIGGIPNRPEINLEAALQPRQVMGTFAAAWTPNPLPQQRHRRSIYALKMRGLSDPAMEVFNSPSPDFSCERREGSIVTPQVFAMFNSRASYARALALASRVLKNSHNDKAAIEQVFLLAYGRMPQADELTLCLDHWHGMQTVQASTQFSLTKLPLSVRRDAVEENTGEKFSFTETLYSNAEFVPDLQAADCDVRTRALADVCLSILNTNEFAYVY